ncbi:BREX-1 system phosphatase PglZ type A [Loigolactobacillus coryniformis]|uniref:BREX-1 system phosphatase PglZ type A n=1 Tax=Loigolactobacillus coryniformis TaxID=1610 RepID=UPI0023415838|nr:BREX-1 system phosphatase PglZ type A [Loigolactobacillus coryniformis]MDC4186377.1 BREX-1 system phosphatase PglZ type A [Loigolactobacillus coryniformis]
MAADTQTLLQKRFDAPLPDYQQRRIIFWYDENQDYAQELAAYQLNNVVTLTVTPNNYFAIKYQLEVKQPTQNFLLYLPMNRPEPQSDPLHDIYLYSQPEFHVDRLSQVLDELHVADQDAYRGTLLVYKSFFENKQRQRSLVALLQNETEITPDKLTLGIFLVLVGGKRFSFANGLIYLLAEWTQEKAAAWQKLVRFGSVKWFWQQVSQEFNYQAEQPSLADLACALFATKTAAEFNDKVPKNWQNMLLRPANNTIVFIDQWQNARDLTTEYEVVANRVSDLLRITAFTRGKSVDFLAQGNTFAAYDVALITLVAQQLTEGSILYDDYELQLIKRRTVFWNDHFQASYRALIQAIRLLRSLASLTIDAATVPALWRQYQEQLMQLDQVYRKFYRAFDQISEPNDELRALQQKVEHFYTDGYLQPLAQRWDSLIGAELPLTSALPTTAFYSKKVTHLVNDRRRVFVIVVDALRYEIASQLQDELNRNQQFDTQLEALEGTIPSYTDLGMAALLPHQQIALNTKGNIEVDGQLSAGVENRQRILTQELPDLKVTAQTAKSILAANRDQLRQLYKGTDVNYIYLDTIDARGDNAKSEDEVFAAVDLVLQQLQELVGTLARYVSATNFFITADHGFLYTRQALTKLDKIAQPAGIVHKRRFVINTDKHVAGNTHTFALSGLTPGNLAVHVPAELLRYAVQGGGSKYVHGGTTLQEMMVPLLTIKTERNARSPQQVEVVLLTELTTVGSYNLTLSFIQIQPVSNLRRSKRILVYLEDAAGKTISNQITLIADYHNDSIQQRILTGKLIITNDISPRYQQGTLVIANAADPADRQRQTISLDLPEIK